MNHKLKKYQRTRSPDDARSCGLFYATLRRSVPFARAGCPRWRCNKQCRFSNSSAIYPGVVSSRAREHFRHASQGGKRAGAINDERLERPRKLAKRASSNESVVAVFSTLPSRSRVALEKRHREPISRNKAASRWRSVRPGRTCPCRTRGSGRNRERENACSSGPQDSELARRQLRTVPSSRMELRLPSEFQEAEGSDGIEWVVKLPELSRYSSIRLRHPCFADAERACVRFMSYGGPEQRLASGRLLHPDRYRVFLTINCHEGNATP
jgi:hypothetical protein